MAQVENFQPQKQPHLDLDHPLNSSIPTPPGPELESRSKIAKSDLEGEDLPEPPSFVNPKSLLTTTTTTTTTTTDKDGNVEENDFKRFDSEPQGLLTTDLRDLNEIESSSAREGEDDRLKSSNPETALDQDDEVGGAGGDASLVVNYPNESFQSDLNTNNSNDLSSLSSSDLNLNEDVDQSEVVGIKESEELRPEFLEESKALKNLEFLSDEPKKFSHDGEDLKEDGLSIKEERRDELAEKSLFEPLAVEKEEGSEAVKTREEEQRPVERGEEEGVPEPIETGAEEPKPAEAKEEQLKPAEEKEEQLKPAEEKEEEPKPAEAKEEQLKPAEEKEEEPKPVAVKQEILQREESSDLKGEEEEVLKEDPKVELKDEEIKSKVIGDAQYKVEGSLKVEDLTDLRRPEVQIIVLMFLLPWMSFITFSRTVNLLSRLMFEVEVFRRSGLISSVFGPCLVYLGLVQSFVYFFESFSIL